MPPMRTIEHEMVARYRAGDPQLAMSPLHTTCLAPFLDTAARNLHGSSSCVVSAKRRNCVWDQVQLEAWHLRWTWESKWDHDPGDEDRS